MEDLVNRAEVKALLTLAALYDRRPVGDTDLAAWTPLMAEVPFDQAEAAVRAHYAETRFWLTPDDVLRRIREERNRRIDESDFVYVPSDPDEPPGVYLSRLRAQLTAVANGLPVPPQAQALRARPMKELISGLASGTVIPDEVRNVLERRRHPALGLTCPACRATPGDVCQSGQGTPLATRVHPSRVDNWAVTAVPCPDCRVPVRTGCLELGHPYPHGAHKGRVEAAQRSVR
jgi:hypothetical protein